MNPMSHAVKTGTISALHGKRNLSTPTKNTSKCVVLKIKLKQSMYSTIQPITVRTGKTSNPYLVSVH